MNEMKYFLSAVVVVSLLIPVSLMAEEIATPSEVYAMCQKASAFLSDKGSSGLKAFEKREGLFVWKDSHVWVVKCEENTCLPSPENKYLGLNIATKKCLVTGKLYVLDLCDKVKINPKGAWTEYWWPRAGFEKPQRRVSFMMPVPGQPYQVVSGAFDAKTTIPQLYKISDQ
jgi:hypothetical protein